MSIAARISLALGAVVVAGIAFTSFERPKVDTVQRGYRGTGMVEVFNPRTVASRAAINQPPPAADKVDPSGQKSREVYQNVPVLGDIDAAEFLRIMGSITEWVSPEQGCTYCHLENDLASDAVYTKVVARRMIQMVRQINTTWRNHVGETGVTCYTCHRGNPVPANVWFDDTSRAKGMAGNRAGQNAPSVVTGRASLPNNMFAAFLEQPNDIRVISTTALPGTDNKSIKQAEGTYGLMMHFSQALGANCTFCHNSRSFFDWDQSTPQRNTAWYGIRMVRDVNTNFLDPLRTTFPPHRLGTAGDAPKLNCATCHQGVYKPQYGASMVKDYPELRGPAPAPTVGPARP